MRPGMQARVLAARDQGGDIGLVQGRTRNGSLLIASGDFLPEGCTGVQDIPPSHYKYGWSSEPQRYCSNASQTLLGAQQAAAAAGRALQVSRLAAPHHGSRWYHVFRNRNVDTNVEIFL